MASALVALTLVVAAAACQPGGSPPPENPPFWHPGTAVTATVVGPLVRIQWSATTGGDPVSAYQITLGTYDGTGVALVPASVRDCYISGLAASTAYTVVVTARDAQMHWSGPLPGTQGRRTTAVTTSSHGGAGPTLGCHANVDTDADGLPNGVETNNGTFNGAGATGTSPTNPDTDGDGIPDGEETLGTTGIDTNNVDTNGDGDTLDGVGFAPGGINLRALGARPTRKDLLVEFDWWEDATCPQTRRPTAAMVTRLVAAYANGPVSNPDGTTGITFIADYGQGGAFTGGNLIPASYVPPATFQGAKTHHFNPARLGIFQYIEASDMVGGVGEYYGNDVNLRLSCNGSDSFKDASLTMHELGHNLGLGHSGDLRLPVGGNHVGGHIPNHNSVMNYDYDDEGIDLNCDRVGDGVIDYSRGLNATLDETALLETVGICNGVDIDWNDNGVIDTQPVQVDLNGDGRLNQVWHPGTPAQPLKDYNDWARVAEGIQCVRYHPNGDGVTDAPDYTAGRYCGNSGS